jgi:glutamine synthetase
MKEGILQRLPALTAITTPSVNSFQRIGPGCWTGSSITWAFEDKEAPLRVCLTNPLGHVSNVEFKLFDSSANPYLGIGAILIAGIDGIQKSLPLRPSNSSRSESFPLSFADSLKALENDDLILRSMGDELSTVYLGMKSAENNYFQHELSSIKAAS